MYFFFKLSVPFHGTPLVLLPEHNLYRKSRKKENIIQFSHILKLGYKIVVKCLEGKIAQSNRELLYKLGRE